MTVATCSYTILAMAVIHWAQMQRSMAGWCEATWGAYTLTMYARVVKCCGRMMFGLLSFIHTLIHTHLIKL